MSKPWIVENEKKAANKAEQECEENQKTYDEHTL